MTIKNDSNGNCSIAATTNENKPKRNEKMPKETNKAANEEC